MSQTKTAEVLSEQKDFFPANSLCTLFPTNGPIQPPLKSIKTIDFSRSERNCTSTEVCKKEQRQRKSLSLSQAGYLYRPQHTRIILRRGGWKMFLLLKQINK